jgi:tRNA A37 threonylcarbamoyladenosine synthetase subunit TsaC/SUA5/YrdC
MDSNGVLLQLIECIERMKSDVKKKMMCTSANTHARKSPAESAAHFFLFAEKVFIFLRRKRPSALTVSSLSSYKNPIHGNSARELTTAPHFRLLGMARIYN